MQKEETRIETLFRSGEMGNIRLAQKACHALRISYYVVVWDAYFHQHKLPAMWYIGSPTITMTTRNGTNVTEVQITEENQVEMAKGVRIYKIRLDGSKT